MQCLIYGALLSNNSIYVDMTSVNSINPIEPMPLHHRLHENFNISNIELKIIDYCRRRPAVSPGDRHKPP
jgi:hypothetical protein